MSQSPSWKRRLLRPFTDNEVSTEEPGAYPELDGERVDRPPSDVYEVLVDVVGGRDGWTIVDEHPDERRLEVEVETATLGFVDDLSLRVDARNDGEASTVHAHSRSRVGEGDFGQNARTVRECFRRLRRRSED